MYGFDGLVEKAYTLSSNELKGKEWDTEAFLVLSMCKLLNYDAVANSELDELEDKSRDYLISYLRYRTNAELDLYLNQITQNLQELYLSANDEQKNIIKEKISQFNLIF